MICVQNQDTFSLYSIQTKQIKKKKKPMLHINKQSFGQAFTGNKEKWKTIIKMKNIEKLNAKESDEVIFKTVLCSFKIFAAR